MFSPEHRAFIGKYAGENSNSAAVKNFKASFENGFGEYRAKFQEEIFRRTQEVQREVT